MVWLAQSHPGICCGNCPHGDGNRHLSSCVTEDLRGSARSGASERTGDESASDAKLRPPYTTPGSCWTRKGVICLNPATFKSAAKSNKGSGSKSRLSGSSNCQL